MGFISRTVGDVVSEIVMSRTAFSGSFFVVEGEDDVKFWRNRAHFPRHCQFVIAGSKPTVINAVSRANGLKQIGILGVFDDDYDSVRGIPIMSVNLLRTDARDIETMLLSSPALDRVLLEVGDAGKIAALEGREAKSVRDALIERALLFGQLRYLSMARGWGVCFDGLSPYRFADMVAWEFDGTLLCTEFVKQVPGMTVGQLDVELRSIPQLSPWSLLHGKDSLNVLAVGLRNVIGNQQHPAERLMQMLRLAFDAVLLEATSLCVDIRRWETSNEPYKILL